MKKRLLCLMLLAAMMVCAAALGDGYSDAGYTERTPITARLNQRMATRNGPGTNYLDCGTYFSAGREMEIISLSYNYRGVPWVQVECMLGTHRVRLYTGLKRFDGVREQDIVLDACYNYPAKLSCAVTPTYGPGSSYRPYDFTLRQGREVTIIDFENGYAMVDFEAKSEGVTYRVWVPSSALVY